MNDEGYFLLLVSPDIKRTTDKPLRKTVVFVVDRSGSMSGKKIEQAKGALNFVLNNLNEGDLFNIIAYDSTVESFRPELQRFSEQTRVEAQGFVSGIYAGGSTNIDGALKAALGQLKDDIHAQLRRFSDRRAAHGWRTKRVADRGQCKRLKFGACPRLQLWCRTRRQQPSAGQIVSNVFRPKPVRASQ